MRPTQLRSRPRNTLQGARAHCGRTWIRHRPPARLRLPEFVSTCPCWTKRGQAHAFAKQALTPVLVSVRLRCELVFRQAGLGFALVILQRGLTHRRRSERPVPGRTAWPIARQDFGYWLRVVEGWKRCGAALGEHEEHRAGDGIGARSIDGARLRILAGSDRVIFVRHSQFGLHSGLEAAHDARWDGNESADEPTCRATSRTWPCTI